MQESDGLVAVRTVTRRAARGSPTEAAPLKRESLEVLSEFELIARFPFAGVDVLRAKRGRNAKSLRNEARRTLKKDRAVQFAGRVLIDRRSKAPVLYTENCFVKFEDDVKPREIKRLLEKYHFEGRRALGYARNAWFISAPEGIGLDLFGVVSKFLREAAVELLHPELIRRLAYKGAFPAQWHLKKATVGGNTVDAPQASRRRGASPMAPA